MYQGCPKCDELWSELEVASYSYQVAGKRDPEDDLPVFFVALEFGQQLKNLFIKMDVNRVPFIGYSTPEMAVSKSKKFDS